MVYSAITGQKIDLDIIINLASILICDVLKDSIENLRGLVNDTLLRPSRSTAILAATTREPSTVKAADVTSKAAIDATNKIFTTAIDTLCEIIRDILKSINDGARDGSTPGSLSANGVSPIGNIGAQCVADLIIQNILSLITAAIATELGIQFSSAQIIAGAVEDLVDDIGSGNVDGALENISEILGGLGIAAEFIDQAGTILDFITTFKFTTNPLLFNTLGFFVLDLFNKEKCVEEGIFNTGLGALKSIAGGGGVGSTILDFITTFKFTTNPLLT